LKVFEPCVTWTTVWNISSCHCGPVTLELDFSAYVEHLPLRPHPELRWLRWNSDLMSYTVTTLVSWQCEFWKQPSQGNRSTQSCE